ncbi:hypothetical protein [Sporosarcina sp. FA9]|uniref:hypothetical protein n=1 Tax=Sporosarcina sp. FA9 TaxID=3413030 RepID=UPI003F65A074
MDNEVILKQAIELLKGLDLTNAESVQINNIKYNDGSSCVEIGVLFPGSSVVETETISCGEVLLSDFD